MNIPLTAMQDITRKIKQEAAQVGFCALGITHHHAPPHYEQYVDWINQDYHQNMWYLSESTRKEKRANAKNLLPTVDAILIGAVSYHPSQKVHSDIKFAKYGWGLDYHDFVKKRFQDLQTFMTNDLHLTFDAKIVVDTAPILERDFAWMAGVGWIGKNTMLMNQKNGSNLYLGAMLTSLTLESDNPVTAHCGTCTACIDACPTQAIEKPYLLNPSKCISYHTIENQNEDIPHDIQNHLHGWVAGCDICQDVCPWNHKAQKSTIAETTALPHARLTAADILSMSKAQHKEFFKKTSFSRIKYEKLQQNVKSALKQASSHAKNAKKP